MPTFGLLGPLLVADDGVPVPVEAPKLRVVLAALLLHSNQTLTVDRLIHSAWDDQPPASARVTVQGHIKRLRQALGVPIAGRIETTAAGYVIRLRDGEFDCHAFNAHYDRARQHVDAGDMDAAAEALAEARRLWRGDPLLDIPSAVLRREHVAALVERYNDVIELHLTVQLALGRHADLVPELRGLVAQYPLRERPYAHLMTALHRGGRTADALEVFLLARRQLIAEAGVEPGGELQALHRSILAGTAAEPRRVEPIAPPRQPADPPAAVPAPAPGAGPAAVPAPASGAGPATVPGPAAVPRSLCQLPADLADFAGRHEELQQLAEAIAAGQRVTIVCGAGGVGKTALAVHAAHRLRDRFKDGQLYLTLHGPGRQPLSTAQAQTRLLHALGVDGPALPIDPEERTACLRAVLADRRLLILLDDAASAAQTRALLPGTVECAVLITSRSRLAGLEAAARLYLAPMGASDAHALLVGIAGADRIGHDPAAARTVVQLCGRLPLALRVAASRFATRPEWSIADLARRLADRRRRLDVLVAEDLSVRATFEMAYHALTPAQARMFRLLAASQISDLSAEAVAALTDAPLADAEEVAESLVDLHLLGSPQPGRYRYHDLLRLFAREVFEREEPPAARAAAVDRLHEAYWAAVLAAAALTRPDQVADPAVHEQFRTPVQARSWLEREHPVIVALIVEAAGRGQAGLRFAADMLTGVRGFLRTSGRWDEWEHAVRAVLTRAMVTGDLGAELVARQQLGMIEMLRGRIEEAERDLTRSLAIARRMGDRGTEAYVLNRLGLMEHTRSNYGGALALHEEAYRIFTEIDDTRGRATALTNLAMVRTQMADPTGGLEAVRAGLALAERLGDVELSVMFLHHQANALAGLGRYNEAIRAYRRCLALSRQHGLREGEAFNLGELGRTYLAAGRTDEGMRCLQGAVARFRLLNEPLATGTFLVVLGNGWRSRGRVADAVAAWREARRLLHPGDLPAVQKVDALLASLPAR